MLYKLSQSSPSLVQSLKTLAQYSHSRRPSEEEIRGQSMNKKRQTYIGHTWLFTDSVCLVFEVVPKRLTAELANIPIFRHSRVERSQIVPTCRSRARGLPADKGLKSLIAALNDLICSAELPYIVKSYKAISFESLEKLSRVLHGQTRALRLMHAFEAPMEHSRQTIKL